MVLAALVGAAGCAPDDTSAQVEQGWDSQDGNPTHATHSYLTEFAVDGLSASYPELATYRSFIVDGANRELHEVPVANPEQEALRQQADGTNWACNHPEVIWNLARESFAKGDKAKAYFLIGIVLHWVEDMGVPAHAFHVYHSGSFGQRDNFELLGLQRWSPSFDAIWVSDPGYSSPSDYVEWAGTVASSHFHWAFPGETYYTGFFYSSWLWISDEQARFFGDREGTTSMITEWALLSAVKHLAAPPGADAGSGAPPDGGTGGGTCSDGIKNQDETSVDCGGVCGGRTTNATFTMTQENFFAPALTGTERIADVHNSGGSWWCCGGVPSVTCGPPCLAPLACPPATIAAGGKSIAVTGFDGPGLCYDNLGSCSYQIAVCGKP